MAASQHRRLVPPPVWFAAAFVAQRLWTRRRKATALSRVTAGVIAVGSALVAASAVATMREAGTTVGPEHPERATTLVTGGPFRVTRNPIYLAMAGLLVARAVLRRAPGALVPAAALVAVLDRVQIPAEERALRARFGRDYERYSRETSRWA